MEKRDAELDKARPFVYTQAVALKAVAFDIDGTLYPDLALRLRVIPFGLRNLGFLIAHAAARGELHKRAASGGEAEPRVGAPRPHDLSSFRALQAELTAARLGWSAERARLRAEDSVYGELEASFSRVRLYRGVVDCLEAFRGSGLRLAALSDFPAARKLEILGIGDYFETARSSEETGILKPAPEPFLALAAELGLEPGEMLYVGNSVRYDVAGARAAGMKSALRLSPLSAFLGKASRLGPGKRPDFAFSSWRKLRDFVLASLEP